MDVFTLIVLSVVGMGLLSIAIIIISAYVAGRVYEEMEEEAGREVDS